MPNKSPEGTGILLTEAEMDLVKTIAQAQGITEDEAASNLIQDAIARRIKRNTGKTPAKIYQFKGGKTNGGRN